MNESPEVLDEIDRADTPCNYCDVTFSGCFQCSSEHHTGRIFSSASLISSRGVEELKLPTRDYWL